MRCQILAGGCFVAGTPVLMASNPYKVNIENTGKALTLVTAMPIVAVPIQEVQLLDYVVAHKTVNSTYGLTTSTDEDIYLGLLDKDPYTSDQQRERDEYEINATDWNEVVFEEVNGSSTAKLALHNDWINQKGYKENAVIEMNLPEQGIIGPFRIASIKHIIPQKKPTDEDEKGDYNYKPVTALFTHVSNQVYNIDFDNGESLGVTYQHPIYSVTANDWRIAGELEVGEKVLTYNGEAEVLSSEKKEGSETVYNLEVKELHNFLVGRSGILVHNGYIVDWFDKDWDFHSYRGYFATKPSEIQSTVYLRVIPQEAPKNAGKGYVGSAGRGFQKRYTGGNTDTASNLNGQRIREHGAKLELAVPSRLQTAVEQLILELNGGIDNLANSADALARNSGANLRKLKQAEEWLNQNYPDWMELFDLF